jgi:Tol biopolymer transport system component/imidazolonepropionase-like amidohydrolase
MIVMHSRTRQSLGAAFAIAAVALAACSKEPGGQGVTAAAAAGARELVITEGTNMAATASPDGRTVVIDLLGNLWTVPAAGGQATRITDVLFEARQPDFSPKGDRIAFQGYLDDGWDIWTVKPDGSEAKAVTSGEYDDKEPQWSPDGTRLAFSSDRSGNYDIWILDAASGKVQQVTKNASQDSQPAWSPDGSEIAFISDRDKGGIWAINVQSGAERQLAAIEGRVSGPNWSADGKEVIYNLIGGGKSRLEQSGKPLIENEDVFPFRTKWLSKTELLYTSDGKIKRRAAGSTTSNVIEFSAKVPIEHVAYNKKKKDFDSRGARKAHGVLRPSLSPDGKNVTFAALGDIWTMEVGGAPKRVTSDTYLDADPSWSPDGMQLAFSSDRGGTGNLDLYVRDLKTGRDRKLADTPTSDFGATWSADGKQITFISLLAHSSGAEIYVVNADGSGLKKIAFFPLRNPSSPTWSADKRTVMVGAFVQYSQRYRESVYRLMAIPVAGGEPRQLNIMAKGIHVIDTGIDAGPVWSPDGSTVAFIHDGYVTTQKVSASGDPVGEPKVVTKEASHAPAWTKDSRSITYLATDELHKVDVASGEVTNIPLNVEYRDNIGTGKKTVHAGKLWNGTTDQYQTDVDIVFDGNRIESVQPHAASAHAGTVIDASGQSVIPGLIDIHAHVYREYGEALGRLMLSYGVTSGRETAGFAYRSLEIRESWDSGARPGPRLWMSAPAFDGTRSAFAEMYTIGTPERLDLEMERAKRLDYDLFKLYVRLPPLLQKRAVDYAHKNGLHATSHFVYPAATFGLDGTEHGHASATGRSYDDMVQLMAKSGMAWCPTLTLQGLLYIGATEPAFINDQRLTTLLADWARKPSRDRAQTLAAGGPDALAQALQRLKNTGEMMKKVINAGGLVVAGTDAPGIPHGAALQAEIESYVLGGLTPVQALRTATVSAAQYLGAGADLGSIEKGKLADLVIVNGDPLADIKSVRNLTTVIKNGQVYTVKELLQGHMAAPVTTSAQ